MPISRRSVMTGLVMLTAAALWPLAAETFRPIPQRASTRVIVDNDFAGDPDGLLALAHHLLSPKTSAVLVTSSFLYPKLTPRGRGR